MDPNPILLVAREYIEQVQSNIGSHIYDQFRETLKQYRLRNIDSSIVISTVETLFQSHPTLLDAFTPFIPIHRSKARLCLDVLNRVGTRFSGGRAYCIFLDCMHAYARAEITASEARDKVVELFAENDDLIDEFMLFLPQSCAGDRSLSKKRKIGDETDLDRDLERGVTRRGLDSDSGGNIEETDVTPPRRTARRLMEKHGREKEKEAKIVIGRDNQMEDALTDVDVRIGNLEFCIKRASRLYGNICGGRISPAEVRLAEHLTALDLACIKSVDRKLLEDFDEDMVGALSEIVQALMKKKESVKRERLKVVQKWNRIRQS